MATPKQKDRNERMYRAALEEFSQHGFYQTSTDDIAAKAGVSKATLYSHFGTKEALFLHVFEQMLTQIIKPPKVDLRPETLAASVRASIHELFGNIAHSDEARLFFHCMSTDTELIGRDLRNELTSRFVSVLMGTARDAERARKSGVVRHDVDVMLIHHAFVGMVMQSLRYWWTADTPMPIDHLADQIADLMLYGVVGTIDTPEHRTRKPVAKHTQTRTKAVAPAKPRSHRQ